MWGEQATLPLCQTGRALQGPSSCLAMSRLLVSLSGLGSTLLAQGLAPHPQTVEAEQVCGDTGGALVRAGEGGGVVSGEGVDLAGPSVNLEDTGVFPAAGGVGVGW